MSNWSTTSFIAPKKFKQFFARLIVVLLGSVFEVSALTEPPSNALEPGQSLGIHMGVERLSNLRDLGGYSAQDGKLVARGKIYRSNEFYFLDAEDLVKLEKLDLKRDYDLRIPSEISAQPDKLPKGVRYMNLNVMSDESLILTPAQIDTLFKNPKIASEKLGGVQGLEEKFIAVYQDFVKLPSAQKAYQTLFLSLLEPSNMPGVFHCTNGKDRTGWGAAALLTFLGVPKDEVFADYMRSNDYLLPMHQKEIDTFISGGGDSGIPAALFGVRKKYLEAAFTQMYSQYGTIEGYFSRGLNISAEQQRQLKAIYLVRPTNFK